MRCVIYAIKQYYQYGGYLVFRKTRLNKFRWLAWFHVLWLPSDCPKGGKCTGLESFVPQDEIYRIFPPPWFKGKVKKGDGHD